VEVVSIVQRKLRLALLLHALNEPVVEADAVKGVEDEFFDHTGT
jgi:hypothetical protein